MACYDKIIDAFLSSQHYRYLDREHRVQLKILANSSLCMEYAVSYDLTVASILPIAIELIRKYSRDILQVDIKY